MGDDKNTCTTFEESRATKSQKMLKNNQEKINNIAETM